MLGISLVGSKLGAFAPGSRNASRLMNTEMASSPAYLKSQTTSSAKTLARSSQCIIARHYTSQRLEPLVPAPVKIAPSSFTVPVMNLATGESSESVELDASIFGSKVRPDLLHQMVVWHLANRRIGTANTKGRGEVAGSTRKIFKQKGTGNARAGSVRATHRKGSGAAHGPPPTDWKFKLNKQVRKLAMNSALAAKFAKGELMIVDGLAELSPKTKIAQSISSKFNWDEGGALIIGGQSAANNPLVLATRNLKHIDIQPPSGLSVYHILRRKHLVLSKDVLPELDKHTL